MLSARVPAAALQPEPPKSSVIHSHPPQPLIIIHLRPPHHVRRSVRVYHHHSQLPPEATHADALPIISHITTVDIMLHRSPTSPPRPSPIFLVVRPPHIIFYHQLYFGRPLARCSRGSSTTKATTTAFGCRKNVSWKLDHYLKVCS